MTNQQHTQQAQQHTQPHLPDDSTKSNRQAIKTLWVLVLAAVLIGAGFIGIGLAFGGLMPTGITASGMRFVDMRTGFAHDSRGDRHRGSVMATDGGQIESLNQITVSAVAADIKLVPATGDQAEFTIRTEDASQYLISTDNGHLRIEYSTEPTLFGLGVLHSRAQDEITISIPAGTQLNRISITSVSGDIYATAALFAGRVSIDSVSGDINIASLAGTDHTTGSDLDINTVSGRTNINQAYLSGLNFDQVSGSASIGVINLDDTRIDANSVSGSVTAYGLEVVSGIGNSSTGSGHVRIQINTVSGSVDLHAVSAPAPFEAPANTPDPIEEHPAD